MFVLIDALDECGGDLFQLLRKLFNLQAKHEINLFATARELPDIMGLFKGLPELEIRASDQDIKAYLDGYLDAHFDEMPAFVRKSLDLQGDMKDAILTTADEMYVCVPDFAVLK